MVTIKVLGSQPVPVYARNVRSMQVKDGALLMFRLDEDGKSYLAMAFAQGEWSYMEVQDGEGSRETN